LSNVIRKSGMFTKIDSFGTLQKRLHPTPGAASFFVYAQKVRIFLKYSLKFPFPVSLKIPIN
jgi:hypothetical protein